jgi:hypothetical protein
VIYSRVWKLISISDNAALPRKIYLHVRALYSIQFFKIIGRVRSFMIAWEVLQVSVPAA